MKSDRPFFSALKDGYYRVNAGPGACYAQLHRGDLIIHQVMTHTGRTTFTTLTFPLPYLHVLPAEAVMGLTIMSTKQWSPITKSEFVEALDQYLPE